jgi:hypothetical protein
MTFDKYIQPHNHHSQDTEHFHHAKKFRHIPLSSVPHHWSDFCHYGFAFFRISGELNLL